MSDYRKVKPLKGTIFDKKLSRADVPTRQRRLGFWMQRGINPAAISSTAKDHPVVESIGDGKVCVWYSAVYLPADQAEWPTRRDGGGTPVPPGVWCEHGGYHKRHTVKQIKSVTATLEEVL